MANPNKADVVSENEELKNMIAQLQKELKEASSQQNKTVELVEEVEQEEVVKPLHPDDYITLVSLCPHVLNLRVGRSTGAETYRFDGFGETSRVLYRDLAKIMDSNKKFTRGGYYYILDERVIRQHGLNDAYDSILKKEEIERIFVENKSAEEIFIRATDSQKTLLAEMVVNKIANGENVDMNLVRTIDETLGRNLRKDAETFEILKK